MRLGQWSNVVCELPDGIVARVSNNSPEAEKRALVEFSERTKQVFGRIGLHGDMHAFLGMWSWDDSDYDDGQMTVFVVIVRGEISGYAICQRHSVITDAANHILGPDGEVLPELPSKVMSLSEIMANSEDAVPMLEAWCLEAIFVLPDIQRGGIGTRLVRTAAASLGVPVEHLALGEPITDVGAALFASMGLSLDKMRRCMA